MTVSWVFVDLDDTIINTKEFKQRFFRELSRVSGSTAFSIESIFEDCLIRITEPDWLKVLISHLSEKTLLAADDIESLLSRCLKETAVDYDFITALKGVGSHVVLFTHGNEYFQRLKITTLGLESYFSQMVITGEDKFLVFRELLDSIPDASVMLIDTRDDFLAKANLYHTVTAMTKEQFYER